MSPASVAGRAPWLAEPGLQRLLAVLSEGGEEARVAGGAVRNTLLGAPVADVDVATTTVPDETIRRAEAAGFKTVPTGYEHGTVTVIAGGRPYETTTLRSDIETDGRRAKVLFGRDWAEDAKRRDFTMNALYVDADGQVLDFVGGVGDIERRIVRFIGDADQRIREDFLRILRFFRFFAWYGEGRPDADGLRACARNKEEIQRLSAERVWAESRKLLAAPDPARTLLWMRQSGVLTKVLPESEKWGIEAIHPLVAAEREYGWAADPLLRLEAIIPPDAERIAKLSDRLRLANAERERLSAWEAARPVAHDLSETDFAKLLYRGDRQGIRDRLRLALVAARGRGADERSRSEAEGYTRLLEFLEGWESPKFPLSGGNIVELGVEKGPEVGRILRAVEDIWLESDFALDRAALVARAAELIAVK